MSGHYEKKLLIIWNGKKRMLGRVLEVETKYSFDNPVLFIRFKVFDHKALY